MGKSSNSRNNKNNTILLTLDAIVNTAKHIDGEIVILDLSCNSEITKVEVVIKNPDGSATYVKQETHKKGYKCV